MPRISLHCHRPRWFCNIRPDYNDIRTHFLIHYILFVSLGYPHNPSMYFSQYFKRFLFFIVPN